MIKLTEVRRADVFDALCAQMKKFQYKTNLSADEEFLMMPDQALVVPLHEAWVEAATFSYAAIGLGFAVGSAATNDFMKKFHVSEALMAFVTVRARHVSPCSHQPYSQYRQCLDIAEPVPRRSSPSRLTPARCATGFMLKAPRVS